MTRNETVVSTESEETSSRKYVEKTAVELKIKCRIDEFEALMNSAKEEGVLCSEGVSSDLVPRAVWKLKIYPNGWKEEHRGKISVFLWLTGPMKDNKENIDATYHLYLISGSGGKTDSIGRNTRNFGKEHYGRGWDVSHARVKKALHADGSLLVAADFEFLPPDDGGGAKAICEALQGYEDREQWATKFSEFHGDQASSDCTIQIGGACIPAHKSFLMAQSPIFRSMFTHQEAEEFQSGTIKITDFKEPEPMRALVRYCYQGQLDTKTMDAEGAVEIFKLADRYCIAGLKALLEKHFANKRLSVENVVALAVLADTYTAPKLKEACLKLIARVGDPIFESADWKEMKRVKPELAADLAVEAFRVLSKKG